MLTSSPAVPLCEPAQAAVLTAAARAQDCGFLGAYAAALYGALVARSDGCFNGPHLLTNLYEDARSATRALACWSLRDGADIITPFTRLSAH